MALLRQTFTSFQMVWKYAHERERESWMIRRPNMTKSMVPFFCTLNFELATCFPHFLPAQASGARRALMTLDNSCTWRGTGNQRFGFKVFFPISIFEIGDVEALLYQTGFTNVGIWWVSVVKATKIHCKKFVGCRPNHWNSFPQGWTKRHCETPLSSTLRWWIGSPFDKRVVLKALQGSSDVRLPSSYCWWTNRSKPVEMANKDIELR